jgi:pimeloyl-ACP methyl ester carboxylesterase
MKPLARVFLAILFAALAAGRAAVAADQEVTLASDPAPLHGGLLTPEGRTRDVAVLLLPGSGGVDRNGSSPLAGFLANDLKLIAEGLAQAGYVSLRIDKRCVGESQLACPGEDKITLQTYVDDTVAWAGFLRQRPGVRCVVILGHSEGALIAALAAARMPTCGLISISGVGRPLREVLEAQIKASGASDTLLQRVKDIDDQLAQGETVTDVQPILLSLFRPSVQPYLISEMRVSPTAAIAAAASPVLVLQGTTDLQVSVEDARRLAAARPGARLVILDGVNHVLKTAPADRAANFATYRRADLPLAPGVMPALLDFLHSTTLARR